MPTPWEGCHTGPEGVTMKGARHSDVGIGNSSREGKYKKKKKKKQQRKEKKQLQTTWEIQDISLFPLKLPFPPPKKKFRKNFQKAEEKINKS